MNESIEVADDLIEAAWDGDLGLVKSLVEKGIDIHTMNNLSLRWAAGGGHLEVVKYLVEQGAYIHVYNDEALRWASRYGYLEVVRYLKSVYIERYQEKFLCYNCLVLPCCTELCSNELVKSKRKMK